MSLRVATAGLLLRQQAEKLAGAVLSGSRDWEESFGRLLAFLGTTALPARLTVELKKDPPPWSLGALIPPGVDSVAPNVLVNNAATNLTTVEANLQNANNLLSHIVDELESEACGVAEILQDLGVASTLVQTAGLFCTVLRERAKDPDRLEGELEKQRPALMKAWKAIFASSETKPLILERRYPEAAEIARSATKGRAGLIGAPVHKAATEETRSWMASIGMEAPRTTETLLSPAEQREKTELPEEAARNKGVLCVLQAVRYVILAALVVFVVYVLTLDGFTGTPK